MHFAFWANSVLTLRILLPTGKRKQVWLAIAPEPLKIRPYPLVYIRLGVLTMYPQKTSFPVPLVFVHGAVPRETKKCGCVIEFSPYFGHLLINLKDIQDFKRPSCPLLAYQFLWRSKHVCVNDIQNTRPQSLILHQIALSFVYKSSPVTVSWKSSATLAIAPRPSLRW